VRETLYRGRVVTLHIEDQHWEIIEHRAAVAILATRGSEMLIVKQRRPAVGAVTHEIPAGLIEDGEDVLTAAAREFAEECGLGGHLELVTRMYTSPGFTDELVHLIRATDLHPATGTPDEDEDITVEYIHPRDLIEGAKSGAIQTSGPAIAAAYHLLLEQSERR
jgi:ADP-ribose pyrophosphatase